METQISRLTLVGWVLVLTLPPLGYGVAATAGFSVQASMFGALMLATGLLWVFSLVPEFAAALVPVVGTLFVGLAPPRVALGGFASPSMVLLVSVFALSATISTSGLSQRLIVHMLLRLPDRPLWHQLALLGSGYALSPMVPSSNSRISLLKGPFQNMVQALQLPARGPGATGLLAAAFGGSVLFGPMMATSKSSNIATMALLPPQLQSEFNGLFWLVAALIAFVVITAAQLLLSARLFQVHGQARLPRRELQHTLAAMGPLSGAEWTACAGFLFFIGGSATVSWHHLNPPYLAGCVLLALLLEGAMQRQDFRRAIDWPHICFLLSLDSMVKIMDHLGLLEALARAMRHSFDFIDGNILVFVAAALLVTQAVRLVLPITAGAICSTVILLPVATAQAVNPWIVVFCAAIFTDIVFFRYQGSNGMLRLYSEGLIDEVDERRFLTYTRWMNGARVVAVLASIPWWQSLGLL